MTDDELKAIEERVATPISREAFIMGGPRAQGIVAEQHRRDAVALVAEVRRLRGLVKAVEITRAPQAFECPWRQADVESGERHFNCEAFNADGSVR